jgi:hypothetical protein
MFNLLRGTNKLSNNNQNMDITAPSLDVMSRFRIFYIPTKMGKCFISKDHINNIES